MQCLQLDRLQAINYPKVNVVRNGLELHQYKTGYSQFKELCKVVEWFLETIKMVQPGASFTRLTGSMSISRMSIPRMIRSQLSGYPDWDYPEWMTSRSRTPEGCIPGPGTRGLGKIHGNVVWRTMIWDCIIRDIDVVSKI